MRYMIMIACLLLTACQSLDAIKPAQEYAVENQINLDKNVQQVLETYIKLVREHPDYDAATDEEFIKEQSATILEQLAIAKAYLALIDALMRDKIVDSEDFEKLIMEIPRIVAEGKDLWEEFQKLLDDADASYWMERMANEHCAVGGV